MNIISSSIIQPQPSKISKQMATASRFLPTSNQRVITPAGTGTAITTQNPPIGFEFPIDIRNQQNPLNQMASRVVPSQISTLSNKELEQPIPNGTQLSQQQKFTQSSDIINYPRSNPNTTIQTNFIGSQLQQPQLSTFSQMMGSQNLDHLSLDFNLANHFAPPPQSNSISANMNNNQGINQMQQSALNTIQQSSSSIPVVVDRQIPSSQSNNTIFNRSYKDQTSIFNEKPQISSLYPNNQIQIPSTTTSSAPLVRKTRVLPTKLSIPPISDGSIASSIAQITPIVKPSQTVVDVTPITTSTNTAAATIATEKQPQQQNQQLNPQLSSKQSNSNNNGVLRIKPTKQSKESQNRALPETIQESIKSFIETANKSTELSYSNEIRKKYESKDSQDKQSSIEDININDWRLILQDQKKLYEITLTGHLIKAIRFMNDQAPLGFLIEVAKPFLMTSLRRKNGKTFSEGDNERIIKGALAEFCFKKLDTNSEIWMIDEEKIINVIEETNLKIIKHLELLCKSKGKVQQSIICNSNNPNNNNNNPSVPSNDSHFSEGNTEKRIKKRKSDKIRSKQQDKDLNQLQKNSEIMIPTEITNEIEDNNYNLQLLHPLFEPLQQQLQQQSLQQHQQLQQEQQQQQQQQRLNTLTDYSSNFVFRQQDQSQIYQRPSSSVKQEDPFILEQPTLSSVYNQIHSVKIEASERQRKQSQIHRIPDTTTDFDASDMSSLHKQERKTALYRPSGSTTPSVAYPNGTTGLMIPTSQLTTGITAATAPIYPIASPPLIEPFAIQEDDQQQQMSQFMTKKKSLTLQEEKMKKTKKFLEKFGRENQNMNNHEEVFKKLSTLQDQTEEGAYKELNQFDNFFLLGMSVCFAIFKEKVNMNLNHIMEARNEEFKSFNLKKKAMKNLVQFI